MPEIVSIADGEELQFREKAMWLLLCKLGGEVVISDEEWSRVPEAPELIMARTEGAMRWVATRRYIVPVLEAPEPARAAIRAELESRPADPEFRQRLKARIEADREMLSRLEEPEASPLAAGLDGTEMPGQLPLPGTEPGRVLPVLPRG